MKTFTVKTAVLSALGLVLLAAAPASAESKTMRFNVPFAFLAGENKLPAGAYTAQMQDGYSLRLISSADNKVHYVPLSIQSVSRKAAEDDGALLKFEKLGDQLVLRAVWASSKTDGYGVKRSKAEMEWVRSHPGIVAATVETHEK